MKGPGGHQMAHHPGRRASWPLEVRELFDTVVRTADARDTSAFTAALDRLVTLADQAGDSAATRAAKHACVTLALRYDPEGLAASIASSIGSGGSLRPLIAARGAGARQRHRGGRGRGNGSGSA